MKGIFLDLDGTLINSEKAFSRCFIDVLNNQFGARLNLDDYRRYELEKNALLIKYAKEMGMINSDIDDKDIMNIVYNNYEDYFKEIIKEEEAVDNFRLIRELKDKYLLGLITTCRRHYLDILDSEESIYDLFNIVIAREDVERLKPDPEAYLKALKELHLKSDEVIAIEDSKRGVDSSIEASIKTIKVDNFTDIKYSDDRVIEEESANKVLRKIINYK